MKVKVKEGKGPIAGYYGTKGDGAEFEVRAGEGQALADADLVDILSEDATPADEPKQGSDMTKVRKPVKK